MFGIFKFRKLNSVLEEANITPSNTEQINTLVLDCNLPLFDPRQNGQQNFTRLLEILYQKKPAHVRLKILTAIHRLISKQPLLAEQFLEHQPREYQGVKIKLRRDCSPLKQKSQNLPTVKQTLEKLQRIDRLEKLDRSTRTTDLPSQPGRSQRYSINEEVLYEDVGVYLFMYLVKPYESYLLKLAAHYDTYEQCRSQVQQKPQPDFVLVWKLINMCKTLAPFRQVLTHIGRYYLSDSKYIVGFLEAITKDLYFFYCRIEQHVGVALDSFSSLDKLQMENIIGVVEELPDLNQALFEIFYGRYFYTMIKHVKSPKWVTLGSDQLDLMHRTYALKYGKKSERQVSHHRSLTSSYQGSKRTKNFEDVNLSFGIGP